jgi:hypothetical protein
MSIWLKSMKFLDPKTYKVLKKDSLNDFENSANSAQGLSCSSPLSGIGSLIVTSFATIWGSLYGHGCHWQCIDFPGYTWQLCYCSEICESHPGCEDYLSLTMSAESYFTGQYSSEFADHPLLHARDSVNISLWTTGAMGWGQILLYAKSAPRLRFTRQSSIHFSRSCRCEIHEIDSSGDTKLSRTDLIHLNHIPWGNPPVCDQTEYLNSTINRTLSDKTPET